MLLLVADFLQSLTIVFSLSAFIPQWMVLFREKSTKGISVNAWILWAISSFFSCFYASVQFAVLSYGTALLLTSVCAAVCNVFTLCLLFHFKRKEARVLSVVPGISREERELVSNIAERADSLHMGLSSIAFSKVDIAPKRGANQSDYLELRA